MKFFSRKRSEKSGQDVPSPMTPFQLLVEKFKSEGGDTVLRLEYDLDNSSIVFDLGGYEGQWASDIYSKYRSAIYLFEPVPEYAKKIARRFERNPDIKIYEFGLGAYNSKEIIYMNKDGSSIYGESGSKVDIQIFDVYDWLVSNGIEKIDLMKINIEGAEYDLLDRLLLKDQIKKIRNIQIQFHDVAKDSRSRMEKIQAALEKTHNLTYQYDFVWENWRLIE